MTIKNRVLELVRNHPVVLVHGGPGSGKTTLPRELALRATECKLTIQGVAFLGKAAARLRAHANIVASTIHLMYFSKHFVDFEKNPVLPDILIIDEAAMCSNDVFLKALETLEKCRKGVRLVIIGDPDQLDPIQAEGPFIELIKSGRFPTVRLRGQHRSGNGIVKACQAINRGEFPADNEQFQFVERADETRFDNLKNVLELRDNTAPDALQIVTTSNHERHAVNDWYRKQKNYAPDQVYLGERVCGKQNDYETGVRNGEIGVVSDIKQGDYFEIDFPTNPELVQYQWPPVYKKNVKRQQFPNSQLDWAACLTGNKCQGSEWDHIVVHLTGVSLRFRPWATRKWLYTCVSRGRKSVVIFGSRVLLEKILMNGAECFRVSVLGEMLVNEQKYSIPR
jgi:exodeoxyribonuclease V alpha subunit